MDVRDHVAVRERRSATVVDAHPIGRRGEELAPVERGISTRDDRPCVLVAGRFADEVSGVEFSYGRVEVVEVESNQRHDPLVGADFRDAEHLGAKRVRPLVSTRKHGTSEHEALPANRKNP
ncbi:hypothetical protein H7J81_18120 [Mycobacterium cookii]|nr:hypothetical protein [Mycobacterium cookii]